MDSSLTLLLNFQREEKRRFQQFGCAVSQKTQHTKKKNNLYNLNFFVMYFLIIGNFFYEILEEHKRNTFHQFLKKFYFVKKN